MDGISSRKLTWGICIVGIAIAIISFFFLPEIIPVHFAGNGVADDFGNKIEIFLTESSKSPASIVKSNKQWVGTCLYQEECKLRLINCGAVIRL